MKTHWNTLITWFALVSTQRVVGEVVVAVFFNSLLIGIRCWQLPEQGFGRVVLLPLEEDAAEVAPKRPRHVEVFARTVLLCPRGSSRGVLSLNGYIRYETLPWVLQTLQS